MFFCSGDFSRRTNNQVYASRLVVVRRLKLARLGVVRRLKSARLGFVRRLKPARLGFVRRLKSPRLNHKPYIHVCRGKTYSN